jgi:hypothetical protein
LNQTRAELTNATQFADAFKQPGMKQMMLDAQKSMLKQIMQQEYGDLPGVLQLDEARQAQVSALLETRKQKEMALGVELMSANADQKGQIMERFAVDRAKLDESLHQTLGEEGIKKFQWYESTQTERAQVNEFQAMLSEGGKGLAPSQAEQLFRLANAEKEQTQFSFDFATRNHPPEDWKRENIDRYFQELQGMNERVAAKASSLLSAEDLEKFRLAQSKQLERKRGQLMMAASVLAPH